MLSNTIPYYVMQPLHIRMMRHVNIQSDSESTVVHFATSCHEHRLRAIAALQRRLKIHQRGVQWKQGVVICMMLYTSLSYNTAPIRCTPLPLHPPCNEYPDCPGPRPESHQNPQTPESRRRIIRPR